MNETLLNFFLKVNHLPKWQMSQGRNQGKYQVRLLYGKITTSLASGKILYRRYHSLCKVTSKSLEI